MRSLQDIFENDAKHVFPFYVVLEFDSDTEDDIIRINKINTPARGFSGDIWNSAQKCWEPTFDRNEYCPLWKPCLNPENASQGSTTAPKEAFIQDCACKRDDFLHNEGCAYMLAKHGPDWKPV